jgi:8-amino-7-oxononanoate synthase
MTSISKAIRQKRFKVIAGNEVTLMLQAPTGATFHLALENCSIMGLGASIDVALPEEEGFVPGTIVPPAKIAFNKQEIYVGRLVLRVTSQRGGRYHYGFQAIDAKLPIDGPLSRVLEVTSDEKTSAYDYELDPDKFNLATFGHAEQANIDLFGRCKQFRILYNQWKDSPRYQYKTLREPSHGQRVNLERRRKGGRNDYLVMASNDYLGLASHPKVTEAAKAAIDQYGFGSTGSPVSTGFTRVHAELNDLIAKTFKKEKAILYNSGYATNVGIITGLTKEQDLVVADLLSHASIQDGMQMAKATSRFFRHNNAQHLEKLLNEERSQYSGALMITEGVFSMDGDVAPLDKLIPVAKHHNCRIMIDEAHSFGVIGEDGLGAASKFGALNNTDIIMGTFSKIGGAIGGFVAADADVIEWLYHFSRAHVFTVSLPPSSAAAALQALKIFNEEKHLVKDLKRNIKHFALGLHELGFTYLQQDHESAVIPVLIGDEQKLGIMNQIFLDEGIFVVPVVYPAVSRTSCRFRFTMTAKLTTSDIDFVLNVIEKAMLKVGFKYEEKSNQRPDTQATQIMKGAA